MANYTIVGLDRRPDPVNKIPVALFHFTDCDGLEKILSNNNLKFSNLRESNDPEEIENATLCLTEDPNNVALWHIYNGFRGYCLELSTYNLFNYKTIDRTFKECEYYNLKIIQDDGTVIYGPFAIDYINTPGEPKFDVPNGKNFIWNYEKEWRYILPEIKGKDEYIKFNRRNILSVEYGCRVDEEDVNKLRAQFSDINFKKSIVISNENRHLK